MANLKQCLMLLEDNEEAVRKEAEAILMKLCNNILKNPQELKYRKLNLSNAIVYKKLLPASGAIECLFEIGFIENDDEFLFPIDKQLDGVRELYNHLNNKLSKNSRPQPVCQASPKPSTSSHNPATTFQEYRKRSFFEKLISQFPQVLRYEDKALQLKVRSILPLEKLQIKAQEKLRGIQREMKIKNVENDVVIEDLLLGELLDWFKNTFFKWFDSPVCNNCMGDCAYDQSVASDNPQISRVEIYKCKSCGYKNQFPRYTDPEPLLYTRRGRCGEWANTFTLICRTVGFDARLVYDETDHVWTEVWSDAHQRWIHADACENCMDSPLLYEKGWGKKLSYVIAFSRDEIQDVTWRYTRNHGEVLRRRGHCSEDALVLFVNKMNSERQSAPGYSDARRRFVTKRTAMELADLLAGPPGCEKPDDGAEYGGRTSGSLAWRISRGETDGAEFEPYEWKIPPGVSQFELVYSITSDTYTSRNILTNQVLETRKNWHHGISSLSGVFRKEEQDWKMAYLCRRPNNPTGHLSWTFAVQDSSKCVDGVDYEVSSATFHGAEVVWEVQFGGEKLTLDSLSGSSKKLGGATEFKVIARMSGGEGDCAWQHAQLFRRSLDSKAAGDMVVRVTLKDR